MISNKGASVLQMALGFPEATIPLNCLHIGLFKGDRVPLQKMFDDLSSADIYTWSSIATSLGLVEANFLGSIACPALTPIFNATARTISIPLTNIVATLVGRQDGIPTYFVARIGAANAANTWEGFNAAGTLTGSVWTGSVGDEDSDAELQFIGGEIKNNQTYKFLDMIFQI